MKLHCSMMAWTCGICFAPTRSPYLPTQDLPAKRNKMTTDSEGNGVGPAVEIDEDLHSRQVRGDASS